ncbi:MAG: hypothetical protein CMQ05_04665 [Gammaproteobacteria bacterium]|nr:hypothetical protein [Gammaproteobacteria bacterium]RPG23557.1 MAG: VCBS repeat-containing protein [Gammaproteobacteria bacterium TMED50]
MWLQPRSLTLWLFRLYAVITSILMTPCLHADGALFDRFSLDVGLVREPTIIPAFVTGGDIADIVVIAQHERHRQFSIYGFDGTGWEKAVTRALPRYTRFVDIANVNGQEHLIAYVGDHMMRFDLQSEGFQSIVSMPTTFRARPDVALPRLRVARDLNGNGRDDLVMPDVDGFWISLQSVDGTFAAPIKVGPPEPYRELTMVGDKQSYGEAGISTQTLPWYLSRLHVADFTGNSRTDLVFWDGDQFLVYPQQANGEFETDPMISSLHAPQNTPQNAPFDAVGMYSVAFEFKENFLRLTTGLRRKTNIAILTDIRDINGDGTPDLTTVTLSGRSVFRLKSSFRVHAGRRTKTGITFSTDSDETRPDYKGTAWTYANLSLHDSPDGQVFMMYMNVPTSIGQFYRILVRKTMSLHLEIYRFDKGAAAIPVKVMYVKPKYDKVARKGPFFPATLLGDVTGSGHMDLLVGNAWNTLHVYPGKPGALVFDEAPIPVTVSMTSNENNTRLEKLTRGHTMGLLIEHFTDEDAAATAKTEVTTSRLEILLPAGST